MPSVKITPVCWKTYLFIAALWVLSACSSESSHRVVTTDIEGVPLIRTEGGPKYFEPLFHLETDLVLGIDEGEPEWQQFMQYPKVLIASDGRMVILDRQRSEVFVVSKDGELLHRWGRAGSGPGEFRNILDFEWAEVGEEFWITDQGLSRVSRFDLNGELLGMFSYAEIRPQYHVFSGLGNRRFLGFGPRQRTRPSQSIVEFTFFEGELEKASDFLTIDQDDYFQSSASSFTPILFGGSQNIEVGPGGVILFIDPNIGRLTLFSSSGQAQYHVERDYPLEPVTALEKDRIRKAYRDRGQEDYASRIVFADNKSIWFGLPVIDNQGRIWIRRYSALREEPEVGKTNGRLIGYAWEIFDTDGTWLGVHVQKPTIRHVIDGYLYQTYMSEAGTPRFERLRIIPLVPEMQGTNDR